MTYVYTHLKQDGSSIELARVSKKWDYTKLRAFIGNSIEYIPEEYFMDGLKGQVIGDEEARYNTNNVRNQHMKIIHDPIFNEDWDVVGDLLLEQTEKQNQAWKDLA